MGLIADNDTDNLTTTTCCSPIGWWGWASSLIGWGGDTGPSGHTAGCLTLGGEWRGWTLEYCQGGFGRSLINWLPWLLKPIYLNLRHLNLTYLKSINLSWLSRALDLWDLTQAQYSETSNISSMKTLSLILKKKWRNLILKISERYRSQGKS